MGTLLLATLSFSRANSQLPYRSGNTALPRLVYCATFSWSCRHKSEGVMQKKPRLVKPKPKSKPKSRASKPAPLRLTLEDELLVRLDALVPKVGCSAAAREFGIVADRHLVARVALLRGLSMRHLRVGIVGVLRSAFLRPTRRFTSIIRRMVGSVFGAVRVMRSLLSIGVPTLSCRDCPFTRVWTRTARRSSYRTHHLAPAI